MSLAEIVDETETGESGSFDIDSLVLDRKWYTLREAADVLRGHFDEPKYNVSYMNNLFHQSKAMHVELINGYLSVSSTELDRVARRPFWGPDFNYTDEEIMRRFDINQEGFDSYLRRKDGLKRKGGLITGNSASKLFDIERKPGYEFGKGNGPPTIAAVAELDTSGDVESEVLDEVVEESVSTRGGKYTMRTRKLPGKASRDYWLIRQEEQHPDPSRIRFRKDMAHEDDTFRYVKTWELIKSYMTEAQILAGLEGRVGDDDPTEVLVLTLGAGDFKTILYNEETYYSPELLKSVLDVFGADPDPWKEFEMLGPMVGVMQIKRFVDQLNGMELLTEGFNLGKLIQVPHDTIGTKGRWETEKVIAHYRTLIKPR